MFKDILELSISESTCQREVRGSNSSLTHKVFLWLVTDCKVSHRTGSAPTTSLQEACTSAVNVDFVTQER